MYSNEKQQILEHTREKVRKLFSNYPVPAHGFEHILRVIKWAKLIAKNERANEFLCEMAAWLHDIGRTFKKQNKGIPHPELSYKLCQKWFKNDPVFSKLSKQEKIAILYAVRYHGNDMANKYPCAYILCDADKLDLVGKIGITRSIEFHRGNAEKIDLDLRLRFYNFYWLKTKIANQIVKRKNLMKPIEQYYKKLLKDKIKSIKL